MGVEIFSFDPFREDKQKTLITFPTLENEDPPIFYKYSLNIVPKILRKNDYVPKTKNMKKKIIDGIKNKINLLKKNKSNLKSSIESTMPKNRKMDKQESNAALGEHWLIWKDAFLQSEKVNNVILFLCSSK